MNIDRPPLLLLDSLVLAIEPIGALITSTAHDRGWDTDELSDPMRSPFSQIVEEQPALIITVTDPLPAWLIPVSANAATRRLSILAVNTGGTDAEIALLHSVGVTVLTPAEITADRLAELIAPLFARQTVIDQCAEPLPELALKGIAEFNAHDYFECHETLETAWRAETGPVRNLYRVILQVGLAYYQIERGQYDGALKMFLRTSQWFAQLPTHCRGVDVTQLQTDATIAQRHLETLGAAHLTDFDRALMKPVLFKELP